MKNRILLVRHRFIASYIVCLVFFIPYLSMAQPCTTYSVTQSPYPEACAGGPVTLTASSFSGTYHWSPTPSSTYLNTATYNTVTATYGVTVESPSGCTSTPYYYTVTVDLPVFAYAGGNGYITCPNSSSPITLGSDPTARGGTGSGYSYMWSGSLSGSNPSGVTISSATTYCVTVTDGASCSASSCDNFTTGPFFELLRGGGAYTGPIPEETSDLETDISDGTLYACGVSYFDITLQNNDYGPYRQILGYHDGPAFYWVAHYDPCSPYPYLWGEEIQGLYPDCGASGYPSYTNGECTQPFTPNIAQDANTLYMICNKSGQGYISRIKKNGGYIYFTNGIEGFILTDIKDDGGNYVFVTGYSTLNSNYFDGNTYNIGDIFVGSIDLTSSSSIAWVWTYPAGLNVNNDNVPSVTPLPFTYPPSNGFTYPGMLLTTGDHLQFYKAASGGAPIYSTGTGPTATGVINTRVTSSSYDAIVYMTDGSTVYREKYSAPTFSPIGTSGSVGATNLPLYDLRQDGNTGNVYTITTNQIEGYDQSLTPLVWSPAAAYNACPYGSAQFVTPDGSDRCLSLDPSGEPLYVGGANPISFPCAFQGIYGWAQPNGFIARFDVSTTGGTFYKTNPNQADNPAALTDKKVFGVYPNPMLDELYIQTDAATDGYSYSLRTIQGKLVMAGDLAGKGALNMLSTSSLASGIYLIQVHSDGQIWTDKIVKE